VINIQRKITEVACWNLQTIFLTYLGISNSTFQPKNRSIIMNQIVLVSQTHMFSKSVQNLFFLWKSLQFFICREKKIGGKHSYNT